MKLNLYFVVARISTDKYSCFTICAFWESWIYILCLQHQIIKQNRIIEKIHNTDQHEMDRHTSKYIIYPCSLLLCNWHEKNHIHKILSIYIQTVTVQYPILPNHFYLENKMIIIIEQLSYIWSTAPTHLWYQN